MLYVKPSEWDEWGVAHEVHKFFLLRWHELFAEDTFDGWQVRSCNVRTVLREVLDALDVSEEYEPYFANVGHLLDEALDIAKRDLVLQKDMSHALGCIEKLRVHANEKSRDWVALRSHTRVVLEHLSAYKDKVVARIGDELAHPGPESMDDLYALTMALAIEIASCGYSLPYLRSSVDLLRDAGTPEFRDRLDSIVKATSGATRSYRCQFLTNIAPTLRLDGFGISLDRQPLGPHPTEAERRFRDQDPMASVASLRVDAVDLWAARNRAQSLLEQVLAAVKLYQQTSTYGLRGDIALVDADGVAPRLVESDKSRCDYVRNARGWDTKVGVLGELVARLGTRNEKGTAQLLSALQFHRLALSATTDEARLINLWIGLEALTRGARGSTIEGVSRVVPPTLTTGYLYRYMTALAIDLRHAWRGGGNVLAKYVDRFAARGATPAQVLALLLAARDSGMAAALDSLVSDSPLLRFRIERVRSVKLSGPAALRQSLEAYCRRVEWQLRRIYRARNHVIHRGQCPAGSRQLIQHLHSYLVLCVHALVYDLAQHSGWNIRDALEFRRVAHQTQCAFLKPGGCDLSQANLLDPVRALGPVSGTPAWGDRPVDRAAGTRD